MNEYLKTSSFIFIFIKNGKVVVDLNGTDYTIEKGYAITMTRNVVYNVKTVSEDYQYFISDTNQCVSDCNVNGFLTENLNCVSTCSSNYIQNDNM